MLNKISVENFKAFNKLADFNIKPITILCGANSCGKSSILQSILLFKQSLESRNSNPNILLNGQYVKFGDFGDIVYKKNLNSIVSFDFEFNLGANGKRSFFPFAYYLKNNDGREIKIKFHVSLRGMDKSLDQDFLMSSITNCKIEFHKDNNPIQRANIQIQENNLYRVEWENLKDTAFDKSFSPNGKVEDVAIRFVNLFPINFESEKEMKDGEDNLFPITHFWRSVSYSINNFFSMYSYIGPLRESHVNGGGFYFGDDITNIGNRGENAPFMYVKNRKAKIKNHFFLRLQ